MTDKLTPPAVKTKAEAPAGDGPKAPKEPKAPKAPKEKKEASMARSQFAKLYPEDAPVTVLAEKNPKKVGSKAHARFELYKDCKTVGEFLAKGGTYSDIAYNVGRSFIKVG